MGRWKLVGALGWALAVAVAHPAAAFERVQDGGFDAANCTATDCVNSSWTESTAGTSPIGPICKAGTGGCADGSGTGYNTGPNWARLGAGVAATSAVAQTVPIPAAPAKLVFLLHITSSANGNDTLTVTVDGAEVFRATDATPGYAFYQRVEIDVSRFAGGARVLRFQGTNTATTPPSDSFDVDEVSLDAPEAPPPPPPPPPPNRDVDGDKYIDHLFGGPDCDDTSAAIHPGVTDVPHDGVDQDCEGGDAPYPGLSSRFPGIAYSYSPRGSKPYTVVTSLKVRGPVGATVTVSCSPKRKGCPFRRKTLTIRSSKPLQFARSLKKAQLKKNTLLSVRVTKPGYIGRLFRYRIRINALARKTRWCLEPGQTTPRKTCS